MIEDNPDWKLFMNLMEALFAHHPVRVSVAGSVESISHITAETLYACHKAFYDPANMTLCVAADVDPEEICAIAREILPKAPGPIALKDYGPEEPQRVASARIEAEMEVSSPIFQLGYKGDIPKQGEAGLRQELVAELAAEALLGNSSPLYAKLYREGLINQNFAYGYEVYPGCAFLFAGGDSKDPDAVRMAVAAEAERIGREGIDGKLWERLVKGSYGAKVRSLNSFENLCVSQTQAFFMGQNFLDFAELYDSITKKEAEELIEGWITAGRTALSIIWPKGERA